MVVRGGRGQIRQKGERRASTITVIRTGNVPKRLSTRKGLSKKAGKKLAVHDISPKAASHSFFSGRGSFRALPSTAAGGRQRPEGSSHTQRHTPLPHSFFLGKKKAPGDPIWLRCIKRGEGAGFSLSFHCLPRSSHSFSLFRPAKKKCALSPTTKSPSSAALLSPPFKIACWDEGGEEAGRRSVPQDY